MNQESDNEKKDIPKLKTDKLQEALIHNPLKTFFNPSKIQLSNNIEPNYDFKFNLSLFKPPCTLFV